MDAQPAEALTLIEIGDLVFRYGVVTVVSLALIILIHEFGHYLAARAFGVKVTKFSIGFGKEIWGRTDKRGTRWSLSRLPIGGYVAIFGDVDPANPVIWDSEKKEQRTLTEEELSVAFCTRKVWQRMVIVAAGPGINVFLALTLMAGMFMIRGDAVNPPLINSIAVGMAGHDAGFQLGDRILEMDGKPVYDFDEIYEITSKDWENSHDYKVLRDGREITITMKSRRIDHTDFKGRRVNDRARIGILHGVASFFETVVAVDGIETKDNPDKVRALLKERLDKVVEIERDFWEGQKDLFITKYPSSINGHLDDPKSNYYDRIFSSDINKIEYKRDDIISAYARAGKKIWKGLKTLVGLVAVLHKGKTEEPLVGGVIKLGKYAGGSAKEGWGNYIIFLTMLSMAIALINILPIPLLDGGFMVFLIYEAITGQQLSPRIQNIAFAIALVFLAGIMIIANLIDLIYLFS